MTAAPLRSSLLVAIAIAIAACGSPRPAQPSDFDSDSEPRGAVPRGKPSAPVVVSVAARPAGEGTYDVTLTARPTRDVPALELMVDGRREQLGPVRGGEPRSLTVRVALAGAGGRDVVAGAATGTGNHRRTRAAVTRVGAPAQPEPSLPVRVITLSDGTELAEVRP